MTHWLGVWVYLLSLTFSVVVRDGDTRGLKQAETWRTLEACVVGEPTGVNLRRRARKTHLVLWWTENLGTLWKCAPASSPARVKTSNVFCFSVCHICLCHAMPCMCATGTRLFPLLLAEWILKTQIHCLCSHFHVVTGTKGRIKAALPLKPGCFLPSSVILSNRLRGGESAVFCLFDHFLKTTRELLWDQSRGATILTTGLRQSGLTVLSCLSWSNTVCLDSCQPDGRRIAATVVNKGVSAPIAHLHHVDLAPHIKT